MEKNDVLQVSNHEEFNKVLAKTLNEFRCSGRLCDVNLLAQGKCVQAHRVVLAARSPYFQAMFSGNFQESEKNIVDIDMSHSVDDIDHLEEVISALYEGRCIVTSSNISSLYHLASFFMYEELKQRLIEKLMTMTYTELDNIIQAYLLALTYGITNLEEKCLTVIQTRFHDYFIYQDDMLQLTVEQMKYLFSRKVHKYCSLIKVIIFLLKWIKQNSERREEYQSVSLGLIGSFMRETRREGLAKICVFLNTKKGDLLSTEFLSSVQDLIKESLVTEIDQCRPDIKRVENVLQDEVVAGKANCLVLVAPGQEIISSVCKKECEYIINQKNGKRIHLAKSFNDHRPMKLAIYDTDLRNWFEIGEFLPKARFDNKNNWKAATVNDQIYFISVSQKMCYTLHLKTLMCQEISMQSVLDIFHGNVKSIVPLAVDGHLIILVSNCMNIDQSEMNKQYVTCQKYFQLEPDLTWTLKSEIEHNHTNTPTSLINVCNKKVIAIKANIVISLGKNLLEIKDGHIFDSENSSIQKFLGPCYLSSPVRLLMNGETLNIVDGEGWKRQYDWEIQEWTFPEKTDLSLVRWCRSVSGSAEYPCLSHVAANAGNAIWEIASHGAFTNYLLKIDFNEDGDLQTTMHTPPPFIHVTLCTAGTCSNQLLQSLKDSEFMELDYQQT